MKKILILLFNLILLTTNSYPAGSSGGETKSNYDQAVKLILKAKKNEKKR